MKAKAHRVVVSALVLGTLALISSQAQAQYGWYVADYPQRLYLGAQAGYNHIFNDSMFFSEDGSESLPDDGAAVHLTSSGFNWSIYLGFRFSRWIAAEVAWDAFYHPSAEHSTCDYAMIDGVRAGLRLHLPTGYNIEPFVRVDLGWYFYGDEFQADENGLGYGIGLGVNYQMAQFLEVELLVMYRAWYFRGMELASDGDYRCGGGYCPFGDEYVHGLNVMVGFHWNSWIFQR